MSEMNSLVDYINGVNGTGTACEGASPGRCSSAQQRGPGRHPVTARTKWSKEMNKLVMKCSYKSTAPHLPKRNYRKRMLDAWNEIGLFELNEQKLAGQARAIKVNQWLSDLELERIRLEVEREQSVSSMPADQSDEMGVADHNVTESNVSPNEVSDASSIHSDMQSADNDEGPRANIDLDEDELQILNMLREEPHKDKLVEPMNLRFLEKGLKHSPPK